MRIHKSHELYSLEHEGFYSNISELVQLSEIENSCFLWRVALFVDSRRGEVYCLDRLAICVTW